MLPRSEVEIEAALAEVRTLRAMLGALTNGSATVTVETDTARYVFPHMGGNVNFAAGCIETDEDERARTYRQVPGYRVSIDMEAVYAAGDDAVRRELIGAHDEL